MGSKLYGKLDGVCEVLIPDDDEAMEQAHADYCALALNGAATDVQRSVAILLRWLETTRMVHHIAPCEFDGTPLL